MDIWIIVTLLLAVVVTYHPHDTYGAHHRILRRQANHPAQPRPGFKLVRVRARTTTPAPAPDYYYYEVPEEEATDPPTQAPTPPRFRGHFRPRPRPPAFQPTPIAPPPSYDYQDGQYPPDEQVPARTTPYTPTTRRTTTSTTTTTTTEVPTSPPKTLSPNYRPRSDGRIIDFLADPNFPRELKGSDLTDYPFYVTVPDNIDFDCSKWHDGFYASIPHRCQLFHYCYGGHRYDFLCPNYTLYDQTTFTCRFINTVECEKAHLHYERNNALYVETTKAPPPTPPPKPKSKARKTTPKPTPSDEQEYEYEYEDETTTTTTTTTPRPKRRRLQRPRLRLTATTPPNEDQAPPSKEQSKK